MNDAHERARPPCQHAFPKNYSVSTTLIEIKYNIYNATASNKESVITQLDLRKAYDSVKRKVLPVILQKALRLGTKTLKLFKSYLKERTHSAVSNGIAS